MTLPANFLESSGFKLVLLAVMVVQTTATVLVARYTRSSVPSDELYSLNHLIVTTEFGKLVMSCVLEHFTTGGKLAGSIRTSLLENPLDAAKILVPALLYLVQNTLLYVALSNLTAPFYQVTYQAKLVTTAVVSVILLKRKYVLRQWIALCVLSLGVAVVVLGESSSSKAAQEPPSGAQSLFLGLGSISIACFSSALAGVYFEKVVKGSGNNNNNNPNEASKSPAPVSVWMRNVQLALFSVLIALVQGSWSSAGATNRRDYFHGFTAWVWVLVGLQAAGGLIVAAVIKYADNVLKGLATGVSVCSATAASHLLFGTPIGLPFCTGTTLILSAVWFFSNPLPTALVARFGAKTKTDDQKEQDDDSGGREPLLPPSAEEEGHHQHDEEAGDAAFVAIALEPDSKK